MSFASYLIGPCCNKMAIITKQQWVAPFKLNIRDLMLLSIFNKNEYYFLTKNEKYPRRIFWKPPKEVKEKEYLFKIILCRRSFLLLQRSPLHYSNNWCDHLFMFLSPTTTYELFICCHKNKLKKETSCGKGIGGRFLGPIKCFSTFNIGVPNLI